MPSLWTRIIHGTFSQYPHQFLKMERHILDKVCIMSSCLFLCFIMWTVPAEGYFIRNCTVHGSLNYTDRLKVLCYKMNFHQVPSDIPHNTKVLDISINYISQLKEGNFKNLTNLSILNISKNHIGFLEEGVFKDLMSLYELNLAHNALREISGGMFKGLNNLTVLNLGYNRIKSIEPGTFQILSNLRVVNLSFNALFDVEQIREVLKHFRLKEIYVGGNNFSDFSTEKISNSSLNVQVLDLSYNPFRFFNITSGIFPNLVVLDLSYSGSKNGFQWEVKNTSFVSGVKRLFLNGTHVSYPQMQSILRSFSNILEELYLNKLQSQTMQDYLNITCLVLPKLRVLSLQNNKFISLQKKQLEYCMQLEEIDLSKNKLQNMSKMLFQGLNRLGFLNISYNNLTAVPNATQNITSLQTFDLSYNMIKHLEKYDFMNLTNLRYLNLAGNVITLITGSLFSNLFNLQVLKLGSNLILSIQGPLSPSLGKLEVLELRVNKLSSIKNSTFLYLNSLKELNLIDNQISSLEEGSFLGLQRLKALLLGSNKLTRDTFTKTDVFTGVTGLNELQIFDNYLSYENTDKLSHPPFLSLKLLNFLTINSQGHNGLLHFPCNLLEGLTSLKELHAGNLNINELHPDTFSYTPMLSFLDLSKNVLSTIDSRVFRMVSGLTEFILSQSRLESLDFLIRANLTKLKVLRGKRNELNTINESLIHSLPLLKYLDLQQNPFTCDCDNAWFINWSFSNPQTQVIYFNKFRCGYPPNLKDMMLESMRTDSCVIDINLICFISSTTLVTVTLVVSFIYHFLRWHLIYGYYLILAFLYDKKHRFQNKEKKICYEYDAFISYNTKDEPWVVRELVPHLEDTQGWKLCLHHRDFEPGKPIIDNIVESIYKSRKTICIISRNYLESEWCSREIQLASFRLFDEKKDILILVFLEDIPTSRLSPYYRMRKMVKKKTYLKWPENDNGARVFWHKLNVALNAEEGYKKDPYINDLNEN
ncbi:toll-like receptor 13 [Polypterus senegalus]|nr:toll-like receptor 13 [Polypterus senegalus]XP_039629800.1 toll-like receptor 13 [Polypterus senegalus]XP_039629801.1 toll-like receptor 13 [Polypterus senegalus]XP_039629802.1 toll-like receptor 13 [Polypterus senegalus]